jgi:hypothetical protein
MLETPVGNPQAQADANNQQYCLLHISYPQALNSGGADRDRTGGLLVANQALSQLSYSPLNCSFQFLVSGFETRN